MTDKKRVLIMEDNRNLALEWKNTFVLNQCDVEVTHNGEDARLFLELEHFDLVITDLFVEGRKGGLHVLSHLVGMGPDAPPSIAVTGSFAYSSRSAEQNLFLAQASRLGASVNLAKPFPAIELVSIARSLWLETPQHA